MRFSLLFMFALLTISAFVSLLYQLKTQTEQLEQDSNDLQRQVDRFDPNLERDVKYLRMAAETTPRVEPVLNSIEADFNQRVEANRMPEDFESDQVVARYIESLDPDSPLQIQFYVPDRLKAKLRIEPYDNFSDELKQKLDPKTLFDFEEPIEFELPIGRSDLEVLTTATIAKRTRVRLSCNAIAIADFTIYRPNPNPSVYFFGGGISTRAHVTPSIEVDKNEVLLMRTNFFDINGRNPGYRPEVGVRYKLQTVKRREGENAEHDTSR